MHPAWTVILVIVVGVGAWYYGSRERLEVEPYIDGPILTVATSSGETYLTVTADGRVGVNTPSPVTTLDVLGPIRTFEIASTTCDGGRAGTIFYNAGNQGFWGCNGNEWRRLDR